MMDSDGQSQFAAAAGEACEGIGVPLGADQVERCWQYRELVVEANARFNLTRITEPVDFAVKHVADSLAVVAWCQTNGTSMDERTVLDVGSGAGVPAIPLAVAQPGWRVTAIDGTAKKIRFIAEAAEAMGLENLTAEHARAEHWKHEGWFDLVTFKAVGPIARCLGWSAGHVVRGGSVLMFKSATLPEGEAEAGAVAAERLGFEAGTRFDYSLVGLGETLSRSLWAFRFVGRGAHRGGGG